MDSEKKFPLSVYERVLANICQTGDCIVMSTLFINSKKNLKLDKSVVRNALEFMQERHPFLNSYLEISRCLNKMQLKVPTKNMHEKIKLEWLDLTQSTISRNLILDESAKFHTTPFFNEAKSLLWKIQIIEYNCGENLNYVMNLVMNQIISDGLSISCISIEIINVINAILDGKECDEMKIHLEAVADLHTLCEERNLFKNSHLKTIEKLNEIKRPKLVLPDKFMTKKRGFLLDLFKLEKELTEKIIRVSKLNGIRLASYYHTVAVYALRKLYLENDVPFPDQVLLDMPANLRFRLDPKVDINACRFLTAVTSFATEKGKFGAYNDIWADARYLHELIMKNTSTETGSIFSVSHNKDLDYFNQLFRFTKSSETASKLNNFLFGDGDCDLAVSNLGQFVNDGIKQFEGDLSIKEIYCSDALVSVPKMVSAIIIHIMYWKGETMFQIGANNYYMDLIYFKRFKELIMETIDYTINNLEDKI
jgi:hypothetical protein